uniref:SRP54-type proteins GTP-binding domain-containing protein n=1 Tax=Chlamydomonas leiostraca TaxID=1034604 RepID=A0A7S0RKM6_9CHLO|mmetsp:Transcript_25544/g.64817  ORF Transcript_25544/g.64817 Transcript_25544/m.64817 type:complete len:365 (+) Transcript_25544:55-1149(+)
MLVQNKVQGLRQQAKSCCQPRSHRRSLQVRASASTGSNLLQRLGRVLKDKAAGDFDRFVKGTSKTRERLGLVEELLAIWSLEDYETTLEELEEVLIAADFGPKTALKVVDRIREGIKQGTVKTADDTKAALKAAIVEVLTKNMQGGSAAKSAELVLGSEKPAVILVVGVNGAGKTTTIGKLAHKLGAEGAKVFLVPGDTFRAAAAEQLAEWGRRSGAVMGPFREGAKPQAVIGDCVTEAKARGDIDVVICDTAGRLHTAYALMEELEACKASIARAVGRQPDETLLVLDGTTGLNMLNQAREFNDSVKLTGLILTKLDGSARGGAVVSVVDQLGLPVKFVGVGETPADLQPFNPDAFAEALFPK